MSKITVWKSLNSNQKDTHPVAAKKARPYPLFPHPVIWKYSCCTLWFTHFFCALQLLLQLLTVQMCSVLCAVLMPLFLLCRIDGITFIDE